LHSRVIASGVVRTGLKITLTGIFHYGPGRWQSLWHFQRPAEAFLLRKDAAAVANQISSGSSVIIISTPPNAG